MKPTPRVTPFRPPPTSPARTQHGESIVELLVVLLIVLLLVATPFGGEPSLVEFALKSIGTGWSRFLAALSVPQ